ncbi:hypothetical protein AN3485.2 [Aspergillus nidulans FGSC A4]|uniref:Uncharacterized protein n=1 Tax=Emericella nidulans (strain FGSC A4 / ATCC 38163 / CBS 112.46 / NRRL 194 / M139) TaxID=227321 RepID=Q5B7J5_EMENI|nr:hypothetical protein [Aspergillus nidulans FGSC A4]EAA59046.1 hypothetical protein AN3485.2 [Aspergillus nidulans FGSC A4]CBF76058.1 TPA: conserved hypothetical protein [Aspergillus nidulans FGSC A4]|eukprot:XP_661089.1 hypothetical protein AN3485.2 [Aspergillus nidulans FGSC A4]
MAWFSSIVNGIGSAANWLLSNSGLINNVLGTVHAVSNGQFSGLGTLEGYVIVEPVTAAEEDCKNDLIRNFRKANKKLEEHAANLEEPPKVPDGGTQSSATLSGLWTNPGLTEGGYATPEMYRDIAKFLTESDMPTELGEGDEKIDVSRSICESIFANVPGIPDPDDVQGVVVQCPQFQVGDSRCTISGRHAHYAIPLGKRTGGELCDDLAWHGAVHFIKTSDSTFEKLHNEAKKRLLFVARDEDAATDGPRWVVTCQVDWRTTSLANRAPEKVSRLFEVKMPEYELLYTGVNGQNQIIKIRAPSGVTPAQVRSKLNKVIIEISKTLMENMNRKFLCNFDEFESLPDNIPSSQVWSALGLVISETQRKLAGQMHSMVDESQNMALQTPEVTVTNSTLVV